MSRSSSGPGRRPLKAEITGSNPVRDVFFLLKRVISLKKSETCAGVRDIFFVKYAVQKLPNLYMIIVFGKFVTYHAGNNEHY